MRRLAPLALMVALAGCGEDGGTGSGLCSAAIEWRGRGYAGVALRGERTVEPGAAVAGGVAPACNDAGQDESDSRVSLRQVRGVPPEVALIVEGEPRTVYLGEGFLQQLEGHPLHDLGYASGERELDRWRRRRCREPARMSGTVVRDVVSSVIWTDPGDRSLPYFPNARYSGRTWKGLPYVRAGDRVEATGVRCRSGGFVAKTLRVSP